MEEGNFVTVLAVNASITKKLVILSPGILSPNPEGLMKLQLLVEMDGSQKKWSPNKITIKNLQLKFGTESNAWIGKAVQLSTTIIKGKESVIGTPA